MRLQHVGASDGDWASVAVRERREKGKEGKRGGGENKVRSVPSC